MISCIIFDCDGTLVDSELLCNVALQRQLEPLGISESALTMLERYRGAKLSNILGDLELRHSIEFQDHFATEYRALVSAMFETDLRPVAGVQEMLSKVPLSKCVASSGPVKKIKQALRVTDLAHHFEENIYSSYDVQSWKPEPTLFLHAAKRMNFPPEECLVIEDSLLGIEAARGAGMHSLLYDPDGVHRLDRICGCTPFSSMADLPKLIFNPLSD